MSGVSAVVRDYEIVIELTVSFFEGLVDFSWEFMK